MDQQEPPASQPPRPGSKPPGPTGPQPTGPSPADTPPPAGQPARRDVPAVPAVTAALRGTRPASAGGAL
ncbi:hypothetical protein [Streptomyces sp. NBC_01190]|uniref:hypothetical protein n=1 Tax=Streptomyces sp. NBC_01190 TaxID=2903767 RepID=UPI0038673625|nr:hypothetical protein OG519_13460 [Streptomyces sp. NBC_01190]